MNIPLASTEPVNVSDATSPMPYSAQQPLDASDAVNDGRWRNWSGMLRSGVARIQHWLGSLGPYVAIELILPGGTIIALALWAFRRRRAALDRKISTSTEVAPAKLRASLHCVTPCTQR